MIKRERKAVKIKETLRLICIKNSKSCFFCINYEKPKFITKFYYVDFEYKIRTYIISFVYILSSGVDCEYSKSKNKKSILEIALYVVFIVSIQKVLKKFDSKHQCFR